MLVPMKEFMIFLAQQHYTNNLLQMEFAVYEDFDEYISLWWVYCGNKKQNWQYIWYAKS